ncbi:phosphonate metabolism protein/1,5-bisphosphokinase (PRPP-forming) PhnN [Stappia sp. F7233]|uniref:Ribose 1,5-bisphosphate phosphokinase PhnN n=1 Tax=Stappia albiluteola TaxID=2758565 RepID=A0A839AGG0_9HYPH|nr:phosphonate metabolism protein/1,5-bisphosphokinase (PRPP-forming) PhnN [Stappia albiluteola]MBA5778950.1 phosphonate metabolism protein/1,5-bisphosphokinase (PRPP-forming) PhnN [Stappia albiluteola]
MTKRLGPGRLVLVVGPSGAGKDTLMSAVRIRLAADGRYLFARRLITRTADPAAEDHGTISEAEFERLAAAGDIGLCWRAHGLGYVLPSSVDDAIRQGKTVIANGSRKALVAAQAKYERLTVLLITAPREILAARLLARGRETAEEIGRRLDRADLDLPELDRSEEVLRVISNTGTVEQAVAQILAAIAGE